MTTPPPSDCPTNRDALVSQCQREIAEAAGKRAERIVPPARFADWPCPGKSGAITVKCLARPGSTSFHISELPAMPCTSSSTGPEPAGAVRHVRGRWSVTRWSSRAGVHGLYATPPGGRGGERSEPDLSWRTLSREAHTRVG